ncbi:ABC transporter permease [Diaminobutyricimonas sp. LJ205]|uniref:ABC transporter permease n=1 Tax=Diaminobutyricimonas sp. LJ205 TaxID=2683590 RepID=UPI0012F49632|nr:ABC transporter permease [Diaminobutyricimonas sp. LJ205]
MSILRLRVLPDASVQIPGARRKPWNLIIGAALVGLIVSGALLSYLWTPYDPTAMWAGQALEGPSVNHILGTDNFGRDVLSRLMFGARSALLVGVLTVTVAMLIGIPLGGLAAARGGWVDEVLMRISDVIFALPAVVLAILLITITGPGLLAAMVAIGIAYTPIVARTTRGAAMQVLERGFVAAARTYGRKSIFIYVRHALPNISAVITVQATVLFAYALLAEAGLSYLGLGAQPPTPSWGAMLREGQTFASIAPGLAIWPGLAIMGGVMGFNLLGDGLRDRFDPRMRRNKR